MANEIESISQGNYILHNIDAKKLYVQEPLFTANSGDAVYVGWRPDETVLWEGPATGNITLSEPCTNFEKLELTTTDNEIITIKVAEQNFSLIFCPAPNTNYGFFSFVNFTLSGTNITTNVGQVLNAGAYNAGTPTMTWDKSSGFKNWCVKVCGCNRKENA